MRVMERFHQTAKLRHLADNTIYCYQSWIEDFLRYHRIGRQWRHLRELRGPELGAYLTHLAAADLTRSAARSTPRCVIGRCRARKVFEQKRGCAPLLPAVAVRLSASIRCSNSPGRR